MAKPHRHFRRGFCLYILYELRFWSERDAQTSLWVICLKKKGWLGNFKKNKYPNYIL